MRKSKLLNPLLVMAAVLVVALFAFSVRLKASADKMMVLKADGITCGSCVASISRALKAEKGVASVAVDVATGRVLVGYDSKFAAPEALASRVASAGYRSHILQVQTIGEFRTSSGGELPFSTSRGCCCAKSKQ